MHEHSHDMQIHHLSIIQPHFPWVHFLPLVICCPTCTVALCFIMLSLTILLRSWSIQVSASTSHMVKGTFKGIAVSLWYYCDAFFILVHVYEPPSWYLRFKSLTILSQHPLQLHVMFAWMWTQLRCWSMWMCTSEMGIFISRQQYR